jgi:transposase InsO family protein
VFTQKIRSAGLLPSFGTVGDGLDNAMMESFSLDDADRVAEPSEVEDPD